MPEILLPGARAQTLPGADVTGLPSKPQSGPATVGTQASNCYMDTFFDQHRFSGDPRFTRGRPWCGSRSRSAIKGLPDGFGGEPQPGEYIATGPENALYVPSQTREDRLASFATAWDAPWFPKIMYFEYRWRQKQINIRYDRMKADFVFSRARYYRAANRVAAAFGRPGVTMGQMPDLAVQDIVGVYDTREDPRVVDAAMSGDQWLLFGLGDVNIELARMLQVWTDTMGYVSVPQKPAANIADPKTVAAIDAAVTPTDLDALIAKAIEAHEAKKKQEAKDRMAKARAGKGKKTATPVSANA